MAEIIYRMIELIQRLYQFLQHLFPFKNAMEWHFLTDPPCRIKNPLMIFRELTKCRESSSPNTIHPRYKTALAQGMRLPSEAQFKKKA
jgi:hypothetical protein